MAREASAAALVTDALASLAVRGHAPVITAANSVLLVRLGEQMIAAFGIGGRETTEAGDDLPCRSTSRPGLLCSGLLRRLEDLPVKGRDRPGDGGGKR